MARWTCAASSAASRSLADATGRARRRSRSLRPYCQYVLAALTRLQASSTPPTASRQVATAVVGATASAIASAAFAPYDVIL